MARGRISKKRRAPRKATSTRRTTLTVPRLRSIIYSTAEKKFLDFTQANFSMAATWDFSTPLGGVAVGTSANNRLGNKIILHSIEWIITMLPLTTMPTSGAQCRWIVWHNKQSDGEALAAATVFQDDQIDSLRNTPNQPKVTFIKDTMHTMVVTAVTSTGTIATVGPRRMVSLKIFPKKRIDYIGTAGTFADLLKDSYGIAFVCSEALACSAEWRGKIVFSDA